jgi:uncharacterized protein YraI
MLRSTALIGVVLLGLTPTLAEANTATARGIVNIWSGPGMAHAPVGWAWPGVQFTVRDCSRLWCRISYPTGIEGWISTQWISGPGVPSG